MITTATLQRIRPNQAKRKKVDQDKPKTVLPIHSQRELGRNMQPQLKQRYRTYGTHLK